MCVHACIYVYNACVCVNLSGFQVFVDEPRPEQSFHSIQGHHFATSKQILPEPRDLQVCFILRLMACTLRNNGIIYIVYINIILYIYIYICILYE